MLAEGSRLRPPVVTVFRVRKCGLHMNGWKEMGPFFSIVLVEDRPASGVTDGFPVLRSHGEHLHYIVVDGKAFRDSFAASRLNCDVLRLSAGVDGASVSVGVCKPRAAVS